MPFHICPDEINLFVFMIQHYVPYLGQWMFWFRSKFLTRKGCGHGGVHHH